MSVSNLNTHLTSIHKRDVNIYKLYIQMLSSVAHAAWVGNIRHFDITTPLFATSYQNSMLYWCHILRPHPPRGMAI